MGNQTAVTDIPRTLAKRDQTIATLRSQLRAYSVRTSVLQSRLNATLDALDSLERTHKEQLAAETSAKERLSCKLDRFLAYVKGVENDRDDLKEAVLELVKRVEKNNNYSKWPTSRIRCTSLLDPLPTEKHTMMEADEGSVATYAPAIINTLRVQLAAESVAHERTREQAESEIHTLLAQLARREAELEACVVHTDHHNLLPKLTGSVAPPPSSSILTHSRARKERKIFTAPLSREETTQVMELATVKNRELEMEIQHITDRLQQPCGKRMRSHTPVGMTQEIQAAVDPSSLPHLAQALSIQGTPRSPSLPPLSTSGSPSPYLLTPLEGIPPSQAIIPQLEIAHGPTFPLAQQFEDQMRRLSAEIDAFGKQRQELSEMLMKERQRRDEVVVAASEGPSESQTEHVGYDEHSREYDPGRDIPDAAERRERELQAEIDSLKRALSHTPSSAASLHQLIPVEPDASQDYAPAHPETSITGLWTDEEQPEELVTPLQPTIALRATGGDTLQQMQRDETNESEAQTNVEPHLVPLPDSPRSPSVELPAAEAPPWDRPPTPWNFATEEIPTDDPVNGKSAMKMIEAFERELRKAKGEIAKRDVELVELRRLADKLRLQMRENQLDYSMEG